MRKLVGICCVACLELSLMAKDKKEPKPVLTFPFDGSNDYIGSIKELQAPSVNGMVKYAPGLKGQTVAQYRCGSNELTGIKRVI